MAANAFTLTLPESLLNKVLPHLPRDAISLKIASPEHCEPGGKRPGSSLKLVCHGEYFQIQHTFKQVIVFCGYPTTPETGNMRPGVHSRPRTVGNMELGS